MKIATFSAAFDMVLDARDEQLLIKLQANVRYDPHPHPSPHPNPIPIRDEQQLIKLEANVHGSRTARTLYCLQSTLPTDGAAVHPSH
jgi:hypothetical protein